MTRAETKLTTRDEWTLVCDAGELLKGAGVAARVGRFQIAIFKLDDPDESLYAVGNYDPIGRANVISRGIVGDIGGEPVVASPLYKQHFSLMDGRCLEDPAQALPVYTIEVRDECVWVNTGALRD